MPTSFSFCASICWVLDDLCTAIFFRETNFQNETYNLNLQNITSVTAGMVCEFLRLAFLSRSNKNILVKVLEEHKLYDDSV